MACSGLASVIVFAVIVYVVVKLAQKSMSAGKSSEGLMERAARAMKQAGRQQANDGAAHRDEWTSGGTSNQQPVQVNPRAGWTSDSVVVEPQLGDRDHIVQQGTVETALPLPLPPPPPPPLISGPGAGSASDDFGTPSSARGETDHEPEAAGPASGDEPLPVETLLHLLAEKGPLSEEAEEEARGRWRGNGVYGRGEVVMCQPLFGRDPDFDASQGTKVTLKVELPGESQVLAPRVVLLLDPAGPGERVGSGQRVEFQGRVRGYRSIVRTLLLENAEAWPAEQ